MTMHVSIRLAWHQNGWNGRICEKPNENTYCSGPYSYPGDKIRNEKDTQYECRYCGKPVCSLKKAPPCGFSINAFGSDTIRVLDEPPSWPAFKGVKPAMFELPPSTVGSWPYKEVYDKPNVMVGARPGKKYNEANRRSNVEDFFKVLKPEKSLILYYANYSNPFNEETRQQYVIIGIGRLKEAGKIHNYENVPEKTKEDYAGGFSWQIPVTSMYPDQGFCLPYHKYMGNPDVLGKILVTPDNPNNFKYAALHISDDDMLAMVEKLLVSVNELIRIGDDNQNWQSRKVWLEELISELWVNRGLYPGMPAVLKYIKFPAAISYYKDMCENFKEMQAYAAICDFVYRKTDRIINVDLSDIEMKKLSRSIQLMDDIRVHLLMEKLVRFSLNDVQIQKILGDKGSENGLYASLDEIYNNPYCLSEQYAGEDINDRISFSIIDHGAIPSPQLGLASLFEPDDAVRLRALAVDELKSEETNSFLPARVVLDMVNKRMVYMPDWCRHVFVMKNFDVDKDILSLALKYRTENDILYLYHNPIFEDEGAVRDTIKELLYRPLIPLKRPVTEASFFDKIYNSGSQLACICDNNYKEAAADQANQCAKIFNKSISVLTGGAGTGKTSAIKAIIDMLKYTGEQGEILLLAPTGKAADRLRIRTQSPSKTIHSLLAGAKRLFANMTFRRDDRDKLTRYSTIIIDECSMIDLSLFAALIRAINWNHVKRLILVGDHNQLPPIGRGKVFYEVVKYFEKGFRDNIAVLTKNIRQLENKVANQGTGILDLAELYKVDSLDDKSFKAEIIFEELHTTGKLSADVDILFWDEPEDLHQKLIGAIGDLLRNETHMSIGRLELLWESLATNKKTTTYLQAITPYRGEYFGFEHLNSLLQAEFNNSSVAISQNDKVMQIRNRASSSSIPAYNTKSRTRENIEVFNGEIGFVHGTVGFGDNRRLEVCFAGKEDWLVQYGSSEEDLSLAYAISIHKSQGSEFNNVFLILPRRESSLLSCELVYTALTRAQKHITLLVQSDIQTLISLRCKEKAATENINSSVLNFEPVPEHRLVLGRWYEEGKKITTFTEDLVRSKSEVIIANALYMKNINFTYEKLLIAPDGTPHLPDFTIQFRGNTYYWEHVGMLDKSDYNAYWIKKEEWYRKHFPGQLITTYEGPNLSKDINYILKDVFQINN